MLEVKNISKVFHHDHHQVEAVKNITLNMGEREFVAVIGPSGCGKTTILKIIAGLIQPSNGEIVLDGRPVTTPGKDRGLVSQSFTLFPWLTVRKNIAFGLDLQKIDEEQKNRIVNHYLDITGLKNFADFYPKNLSGGMQQRIAIARTLANNPKILLMDEPFGSLDSQTRSQMQDFLTNLWEKENKTIIFITHDVAEAIFLADKIYVLSGRPTEIKKEFRIPFARPRTHDLKEKNAFFELEKVVTKALEG
jgi:NitT/TauT family transport system ATP-binding protein